MENPIGMDDLGVPLFSETPMSKIWMTELPLYSLFYLRRDDPYFNVSGSLMLP